MKPKSHLHTYEGTLGFIPRYEVLGAIPFYHLSKTYIPPSTKVTVPNVVGLRANQALQSLTEARLAIAPLNNLSSDVSTNANRLKVYAQSPTAGTSVDRDTIIYLSVGLPVNKVQVYNNSEYILYIYILNRSIQPSGLWIDMGQLYPQEQRLAELTLTSGQVYTTLCAVDPELCGRKDHLSRNCRRFEFFLSSIVGDNNGEPLLYTPGSGSTSEDGDFRIVAM